jgi:hypothetical protein
MRPERVGEMLVDNRNPARVLGVRVVKAPPAENRNAHGLEVLRADDIPAGDQSVISVGRLPFGLDRSAPPDVTHWNRERKTRVLDARDRPHPPLDVVKEGSAVSLCVPDLSDVHVNIQDAVRSKAQIGTLGFEQAPHEQPATAATMNVWSEKASEASRCQEEWP